MELGSNALVSGALNTYFLQYLVPDLGFYGSSYWGVDVDYLELDRETANEHIMPGSGMAREIRRTSQIINNR